MNLNKLLIVIAITLFLTGCGGGSNETTTGAETSTEESTATEATTSTTSTEPEAVVLQNQIVVIGDSIGAGTGATSNFPSILEALTGIPVINVSTPGISAEGGASRAPELLSRFNPKYLVVLLGTNNAAGAGGGVGGAINALRFVAGVAASAGAIPIIGTLPPISRNANENANAFAITGGILGIGGARIARIDTVVSLSEISDGLHPNDSGQAKIANLFAAQIF